MTTTAGAATVTFRTQAFIDGNFCDAASGEQFVSINPATGKTLVQITSCDRADVDRAVGAARRAFEDGRWSRQSPEQRKETLLRFAQLLEEDAEEIALLDALDAGKPITDCRTIDVPRPSSASAGTPKLPTNCSIPSPRPGRGTWG